ncbi:hypothetical protein L1049_007293 [Liquidambar formosana]|uniref:CSC1-like protein n=1 Tax=Liquidambar formosana TaxID=63359 RepID=A0AAP0RH12_LIQFO
MLVSSLLTSVGINFGLCVLYITLYSILRKQPSHVDVYAPRLLAEGNLKQRSSFNLERLLPSHGWLKRAWKLSEEDLLSSSGLDAVVLMRLFIFSLRVFSFAGIIGIFVLLPLNCTGTQAVDFSDLSNNSLDVFTISNLESGSKRLWVHFCAVYAVTGFVCYLLYYEYNYVSTKRIAYFYSSKPQPHQFTILVRSIPVTPGSSVSDSVERFFTEYYPSTYLSHAVVHRTSKLQGLINDAKKLYKRLIQLQSDPSQKKFKRDCCFGLCGRNVDLVDQYEKKVRRFGGECEIGTIGGFIGRGSSFEKSINTTSISLVPISKDGWVGGWGGRSRTFVSEVITGYLPSLILQMFLKLVPPVMEFLSSIQGYISHSEIEKSACNKVLWFTIWNIFFATVFSGSILSQLEIFLEPKNIPAELAVAVPAQASFFIAYVVTSGWTSTASELFRLFPFIWSLLRKPFTKTTADEFEVPSIPYHRDIPRILFFGLLGITYFFLAPLILPFLLVYFCLGYIIFRNQFLNVYAPRYETGGKFWPIAHNSMIFSLVLMQAIAVGIFALKKVSLASSLTIPLPVLTLLFNEYCRKRFLPNFIAYSAESLIKKDREDQNDATMAEYFDKMATAYQDPALLPIQYSENTYSLNSPLLSSAESRG